MCAADHEQHTRHLLHHDTPCSWKGPRPAMMGGSNVTISKSASRGRRLQQAAPSELFASSCAAINFILRNESVPPAQDQHYLGPFTQYPPTHPPADCPWQMVTSGEEASRIMAQPTPRVKFIEALSNLGNLPTAQDPPMRAPAQGLTPAPGTIVFFQGNGMALDMLGVTADEQPWPATFNDTANRSVRVMWGWHQISGASVPIRPASLAFTYLTNFTTRCRVGC